MSKRNRFDKEKSRQAKRRHEWVTLLGGDICVREMNVSDAFKISERSQRPSIDPRGGFDTSEAVLWQIIVSCFADDGPEAERIFSADSADDARTIYTLSLDDFTRLMTAINRVNGKEAEEVEILRDFTAARRAAPSSPS